MKSFKIRIIFVLLSLLFLAYAVFFEKHIVFSLMNSDEFVELNSGSFTETTTFDGLMVKDGKIYDIYSLTPEVLQEKDCST